MWIAGDGGFWWDIVGESHYQDALHRIAGPKIEGGVDVLTTAVLVKDDNNKFDKNAVAVFIVPEFPGKGIQVGYLDRSSAKKYRGDLSKLTECADGLLLCRAKIVGGWDNHGLKSMGLYDPEEDGPLEGAYGVKLDIQFPISRGKVSDLPGLTPTVTGGS